jgi:hypothetical protein
MKRVKLERVTVAAVLVVAIILVWFWVSYPMKCSQSTKEGYGVVPIGAWCNGFTSYCGKCATCVNSSCKCAGGKKRANNWDCAPCGGPCFLGETLVVMANGDKKRIDQVQPGDMVLSAKSLTPTVVLFVDHVKEDEHEVAGFNGEAPFITTNHALMGANGKKMCIDSELAISLKHWDEQDVCTLEIGSTLLKADSSSSSPVETLVEDISVQTMTVPVFNLVTADHSFIANGFCVFDDFPEIEKHPETAMRVFHTVQLMMEQGMSFSTAVEQSAECEVDLGEFEPQLKLFLELAASSNEFVQLADRVWAQAFDQLSQSREKAEKAENEVEMITNSA